MFRLSKKLLSEAVGDANLSFNTQKFTLVRVLTNCLTDTTDILENVFVYPIIIFDKIILCVLQYLIM